MIKNALAQIIVLGMFLLIGCQNDPINSNFGDESTGIGTFKTDTIFNINFNNNFVKDELPVKFASYSSQTLVLMKKKGVKTRLVLSVPFLKQKVFHKKAEFYLNTSYYSGDDSLTHECNVYLINEQWDSTLTQNPLWQNDYQSFIADPVPVGKLFLSGSKDATDTLRLNKESLGILDNPVDTTIQKVELLVDLPENKQGDFVKAYNAFASGNGPTFYFEYKYMDEGVEKPDTNTYNASTATILNYVGVEDHSDQFFNDPNYYYLKTYNPTHLWFDIPFDSLKNNYTGKNIQFLAANLFVPIDSSASYVESISEEQLTGYQTLRIFPKTNSEDSTSVEREMYSNGRPIIIKLAGWKDSTKTYLYNSSKNGQRDLGELLLLGGLESDLGHNGWLLEPATFDQFFQVYGVNRSKNAYLVIKYYERPNPRF